MLYEGFNRVSVVTVSGAPETAPIEPSSCQTLPPAWPAVYRNTIALCSMASVSEIVPPHTAFRLVTCHLNTSIASIKAWHLPLKEPHTFSSPFPSPVCLTWCTALLPRCHVIQWLPFSSMALERPMVIWMFETLRPCYCHFIGNWPICHGAAVGRLGCSHDHLF